MPGQGGLAQRGDALQAALGQVAGRLLDGLGQAMPGRHVHLPGGVARAGRGQPFAVDPERHAHRLGRRLFVQATGKPQQQGPAVGRRRRGQQVQAGRPLPALRVQRTGCQQAPVTTRPFGHRQLRGLDPERADRRRERLVGRIRVPGLQPEEHPGAAFAAAQEGGQRRWYFVGRGQDASHVRLQARDDMRPACRSAP
ncbi:hypothetical protein [Pseudoxanthomonas suwonensis]